MRILTWNVRGAASLGRVPMVRGAMLREGVDILCLLEHKIRDRQRLLHFGQLVSPGCLMIDNLAEEDKGRIAIFYQPRQFTVSVRLCADQFIHVEVRWGLLKFNLVAVFAYNKEGARRSLWPQLDVQCWDNPTLVCGDFNVVRTVEEHWGGTAPRQWERNIFNEWIEGACLEEPQVHGNKFTWATMRSDEGLIKSRLDRCLVSHDWYTHMGTCVVQVKDREGSDHCPVFISLGQTSPKRAAMFRYYNHWQHHEDFLPLVRRSWGQGVDGTPTYRFFRKLRRLSRVLAPWAATIFGNASIRVNQARERLKKLTTEFEDPEHEEVRSVRIALQVELQREEWVKRQESRIKWLNQGDQNTKYFHKMAALNDTRNRISSITINGECITDPSCILTGAMEHHKSLVARGFLPTALPIGLFQTVISEEDNRNLMAPISMVELKEVMGSANMEAAPGHDGFNHAFYRDAWAIINKDMLKMLNDVLKHGRLLREFNSTLITMIPKKEVVTSFGDFRPISVCTVAYRIFSKILAGRLRPLLSKFVSLAQCAFVKGRTIGEATLLAHEIMSRTHVSTRQVPTMCIKVDLAKAFDSVDWSYLTQAMQQLGFSPQWCRLVNQMVRASFQVKLNAQLSPAYLAANGLRQGDPLSPYLFVIAMEGLSRMVERGVAAKVLAPLSKREVTVSHTMYADDLMFYLHATIPSAVGLKQLLDRFGDFSGLRTNFQKSEIIFGGPLADEHAILHILQMPKGTLPTTYLGLPLISRSLNRDDCSPLLNKIRRRLTGWAGKLLSFAGRVELVKAVMTSMHLYWTSTFKLPVTVIKDLNSMFLHFIWQDKVPMIGWEKCCMPKQEGGLGFRDIHLVNQVALLKCAWKLFQNTDSLWVQWIVAKYLQGNVANFWNVRLHQTPSSVWRSIFSVRAQATAILPSGRWALGPHQSFSFQLAYNALRERLPVVFWSKEVWHRHRIPRHSSFLWQVVRGEIKTQEWLRRKAQLVIISRCVMCDSAFEDKEHLLVGCPYAQALRAKAMEFLQLTDLAHPSILSLTMRASSLHKDLRYPYRLAWAGMVYGIWRERNYRLFDVSHRDNLPLTLWMRLQPWIELKLQTRSPL
jgi:exonuclease III